MKRKDIHQIPASRSMAHTALCVLLSMGLSIPGGIYHYAPWSSAWVGTANGETRGSEAQSMSWFPTSRSPWIGCFLTEGQFFPASCSPQIWFWVWYCLSPDAAASINFTIPVACLEEPNTQINIIFVNINTASLSYPDVSLLLSASLLLTTG